MNEETSQEISPEVQEYADVAKEVEELLASKGYALQPYVEPRVRLVKVAQEETNEDN